MRIEDCKVGMRVKRDCMGCPDFAICKGKEKYHGRDSRIFRITDTGDLELEVEGDYNTSGCPASQFTPIDAAKEFPVLKVGDRVRIHKPKNTNHSPVWTPEMDVYDGADGTVAAIDAYGTGIVGLRGIRWVFRPEWLEKVSDKGDEKSQPVETFLGGFKPGDRIVVVLPGYFMGKTGTILPVEEWYSSAMPRVSFRLDDDGETKYTANEGDIEHLKEEVTPAIAAGDDMKIYMGSAGSEILVGTGPISIGYHVVDDAGSESKHHDEIPDQDDALQVLCLMCGAEVEAAHELEHRRSLECIHAREYPPTKLDTWKCHCGAAGRYIDLEPPFVDCPYCGGEVQDS